MEIDGKTIAIVAAAVLGGGGAGFGVTEVRTEVALAEHQIQLDNIRDVIINRIVEHKGDVEALKADIARDFEALDERLDRHGERLLELEKRE